MGLDMYLVRKQYVWSDDRKNLKITGLKNPVDPSKVSYIVEEVGYWRKANAIHSWFVENVQDGEDDCGHYTVDEEQLKELRDLCKDVINHSKLVKGKVVNGQKLTANGEWENQYVDGMIIEDPSIAAEMLPTKSGFFFGNTDYNEWYLADLKETVKIIDNALKVEGAMDEYEYHSSW